MMIHNYTDPEEHGDPEQHPLLPKLLFRLLITGISGCGKTNLMLNLVYDYLNFDRLYGYAKDIYEPKYAKLQENFSLFDGIEEEHIRNSKSLGQN